MEGFGDRDADLDLDFERDLDLDLDLEGSLTTLDESQRDESDKHVSDNPIPEVRVVPVPLLLSSNASSSSFLEKSMEWDVQLFT